MKPDLYAALGVNRDADLKTVRAAYRKAARKAHPDAGGGPREWALVKLAADVLTDEERRARYDATGDDEEKALPNAHGEALALAFTLIQQQVASAMASGADPEEFDLIRTTILDLEGKKHLIEGKIRETDKAKVKFAAISRRFKARKGKDNLFAAAWDAQIRSVDDGIANLTLEKIKVETAIAILKDHEFMAKEKPGYHPHPLAGLNSSLMNQLWQETLSGR